MKITDSEAAIISIVENVQRMNFTPLEEAKGYQTLIEQGFTQEKIALSVNKSRSYIANMIRLLNLPKEIQIMVANEEITMSHARSLINKENNIQQAYRIKETKTPVNKLEKDDDITFLEESLSNSLKIKVEIEINKKHSGKIILFFKNLPEFDCLVEQLSNI